MRIHRSILIGLLVIAGVLFGIGMAAAQESTAPLTFATNTPPAVLPTLPGFATNTPQPSLESLLPETTFDRYALRLWDESALTQILLDQVQQLGPGDDDRKMAIRLIQYELQKRFPGAPRDPAIRQMPHFSRHELMSRNDPHGVHHPRILNTACHKLPRNHLFAC